jgi:hypothetical protein
MSSNPYARRPVLPMPISTCGVVGSLIGSRRLESAGWP